MSQIFYGDALKTLTGNGNGLPVFPAGGNITLVGGTGIAITGNPGTHTITISNTGAEASSFVADSGTAVPVAGALKIIGFIGDHIITVGSGNEIQIALAGFIEDSIVIGNAGGGLSSIIPGLDGEILIGATGASPEFSSLQSSSGTLSFVKGPNSLDINVVGGGMSWSTVSIDTAMVVNNGYVTAGASQIKLLLPATSSVGQVVKIIDSGLAAANSPYRITQNANQYIASTLQLSTSIGVGGYLECAASADEKYAATTLRCIVADTVWVVEQSTGLLQFN